MKKFAVIVLVIALVFTICSFVSVAASADLNSAPAAKDEALPATDTARYDDDTWYAGFYGRLVLPYTGIDVALYSDFSQAVCDRWDSACFFPWENYSGYIIADHSNQEFSVLPNAYPGEIGQIVMADGTVKYIVCVEVFNGHNTGYEITDSSYNSVLGKYDITMYTCMDGWQNVRVCQWDFMDSTFAVQP